MKNIKLILNPDYAITTHLGQDVVQHVLLLLCHHQHLLLPDQLGPGIGPAEGEGSGGAVRTGHVALDPGLAGVGGEGVGGVR